MPASGRASPNRPVCVTSCLPPSTWDFSAGNRNFNRYFETKAIPHVRALLANYGPIAAIWFDTPGPISPAQSRMLVDMVHQAQPQALVNSRIGNSRGDYVTLGDMEIPLLPREGLWESVDTTNDSWGYAAYVLNWKTPREIAERLVRVVSRGGVYMLNVGPDGKGRIPAPVAQALAEVGRWMNTHEKAIHGVGATPFGPLPWGECTTRGNIFYLHVLDWPASGRLFVPGLKSKILDARPGQWYEGTCAPHAGRRSHRRAGRPPCWAHSGSHARTRRSRSSVTLPLRAERSPQYAIGRGCAAQRS